MDIWQVLTIGVRRWKLTVPLAMVCIAAAWVFSGSISPVYQAEGALLYLPPSANIVDVAAVSATDPASSEFDPTISEYVETRNPFAGSIRSAVLAAELYIDSRAVQNEFDESGLSTDFAVVADNRNAVLYFNADASTAKIATETLDRLMQVATDDLNARQAAFGVDPVERITAQTVTKDELAVIDLAGRTRVRAILLILAVIFAFGAGVLVEGYQNHKARHLSEERGTNGGGDSQERALKIQDFDDGAPDDEALPTDLTSSGREARSHLKETITENELMESSGHNQSTVHRI